MLAIKSVITQQIKRIGEDTFILWAGWCVVAFLLSIIAFTLYLVLDTSPCGPGSYAQGMMTLSEYYQEVPCYKQSTE